MDKETKRRALEPLVEKKKPGSKITYPDIEKATGHARRQPMRLPEPIDDKGSGETLRHGNEGRAPSNTATEDETGILREPERPYPTTAMAQSGDFHVEDVLQNPERADDVERLGLVVGSPTWLGGPRKKEGWVSPMGRPPRGDGQRERHPRRPPLPRRGMLCQVDATPYDRPANSEVRDTRLAVDDATTEVLGCRLVETECLRGYCRMTLEMPRRSGIPQATCSDKDTVFRSAKGGGPTQFADMMSDLGIRMAFANSPQAKGRVERHDWAGRGA